MKIAAYLGTVLLLISCTKKRKISPESFKIHPDFKIELVASEPLVFDPVDFQFSPSGSAYVLEMPGYPLSDAESRIILLKDNNEDGIFDERKIYAKNLGVASSFMFYKGGLLVASPPNLIWINDQDQNDEAEERVVLMDGFSNENLQHNFNGLTYGLDNWIYAANGGNSGNPYFLSKPQTILDLRGGDLRLDIENEIAQRVGESSGGFKLTFDSWGRLYETHNLEHVSQLVFEDRYFQDIPIYPAHTLTNISDHDENGLSRIYPIGEQDTRVNHPEQSGYFSGACGITYYGGGIFPENLKSPLLVADCVLNLVHMDLLTQNGSVSKAVRNREKVEFLASSDRAFRPVNMSVGPDGALYVVDMHRVVIEHPEWIPDEMEATMDINAGKDQGRIYRVVPISYHYNKSKNLEEVSEQELVTALGSKNQWTRKTAQQILVTNNIIHAVPMVIEQLKTSENPLAKLHSLWTLEGLNSLDNNQLKDVLNDPDDPIIENALKIAETRLEESPEYIAQMLGLVVKGTPRIRMQAALSLSTMPDTLYNSHKDEIASVIRMTLQEIKSDQWSKIAMVLALSRQAYAFTIEELLGGRVILNDQKEVITHLVKVIGKERDNQHIAVLLSTLQKSDAPRALKASLITSLSEGYAQGQGKALDNVQRKIILKELIALENTDLVEIIRATGELRLVMGIETSKKINDFIAQAQIDLLNNQGSIEDQLIQLQLIGLSDYKQRASLLYTLLDSKRPLVLQRESLKQLWNSNEREVGPRLIDMWPSLGPEARKHATDILLYKSFNHDPLLTAMENGIVNLGEFNLDLERRRVMLFSDDEDIRNRAEALFSDSGVVQRKQVIEEMKPALALSGDSLKGKGVFENLCSSCHIYGNSGNEVGPVLTEISRKSKEALIHEILDPNAAVDTRYLNYKVVTTDGSIYFGLVSNETDTELVLKMAGGEEIVIPKNTIEVFLSTGKSLMPEGLEAGINKQQMADLLAFLQQAQ